MAGNIKEWAAHKQRAERGLTDLGPRQAAHVLPGEDISAADLIHKDVAYPTPGGKGVTSTELETQPGDRTHRESTVPGMRTQDYERLSAELSERGRRDQEVRRMGNPPSKVEIETMRAVDADNVSWFRGVVAEYGWPGADQVGREGARSAWLIVQHGPLDLQKQCLPLLRQSVAEGKASRIDLAYLDDRVRTREKRPQLYGTQSFGLEGPIRLLPIETPGRVNERRAELGLPPLEPEDIAKAWTIEEISALSITY
ncbi:DUF6624 domain-containing protein [Nocardia yamanashiensis]|uniref:DUF6624 domain-containing protein n=1 Tax=Nocardia yamanashiensis TaxID=209247 RepID=UPI0012FE6A62|nr:DUF6624 domain-containing protein [Nocardia yamanashiensis]